MKEVQLTGKYNHLATVVDDDVYDSIGTRPFYGFKAGKLVYARVYFYETQEVVLLHRWILGAQKGQVVDHKNRDSLDNRRENIRIATVSENAQNRCAIGKTAKYKGVFHMRSGKWIAMACLNGNRQRLGNYDTEDQAAYAYNLYMMQNGSPEFILLNDVEPQDISAQYNRVRARRSAGSSIYRGVSWRKSSQKWFSCAYVDYKQISLGYYEFEEDAARAYNRFVRYHRDYEFVYYNDVDPKF